MTFKEWFTKFHSAYCEDVIAFDKSQDYKYIAEKCFFPLNSIELDSIKPIDIQLCMKNTLSYSNERQRTAYFLLKRVFREAIVNELCTKNPCDSVKPPRRIRKDAEFFDPEDLKHLFDDDSRDCRMFQLDLWTGLRRGELLALHWDNIDLDKRYIHVCQTLVHTRDGDKVFPTTKSRSDRLVPLHDNAVDILCAVKARDSPQGFLFTSKGRDSILGLRAYNRAYVSFYRKQQRKYPDLPYLSPHKLRHSYATYLIQSGADIETLRALLGHVDISTTQRYVHSNLRQMISAVNNLHFGV